MKDFIIDKLINSSTKFFCNIKDLNFFELLNELIILFLLFSPMGLFLGIIIGYFIMNCN
jgi:hypothetical protein